MENFSFHIFQGKNFIDATVYQYGREQCAPSHSFGPAVRQHYLFHYIISGQGRFVSTNSKGVRKEYCLSKNQGFIIYPNQCCYYIADDNEPWEYIWVEFAGLKIDEHINLSSLTYDNPIYQSKNDEYTLVKNSLLNIINSNNNDYFEVIGHLYLFLSSLKASSKTQNTSPAINDVRQFYISEAINYIEHNYPNNITVEEISDFCGLNRSYFGKIFKKTMNISPQEFLIKYRMIKACTLLTTTNYSIKEVGEKVGYANQLHFSKVFKNTYNMSPSNYKLKNSPKK